MPNQYCLLCENRVGVLVSMFKIRSKQINTTAHMYVHDIYFKTSHPELIRKLGKRACENYSLDSKKPDICKH